MTSTDDTRASVLHQYRAACAAYAAARTLAEAVEPADLGDSTLAALLELTIEGGRALDAAKEIGFDAEDPEIRSHIGAVLADLKVVTAHLRAVAAERR